MKSRWLLTSALVGSSFAGGLLGTVLLDSQRVPELRASSPLPAAPTQPESLQEHSLARFDEVIRRTSPAVVTVDAIKPPNPTSRTKPVEESGSGAIVRLPGFRGNYVLTNHHVISGARTGEITVTLADGRILMPEKIWNDAESDIAILQLNDSTLPALDLADSDRVRIGQWVLAFGSPFGLHQSVTHGIISARDRGQISLGPTIRIKDFLQTDAPINPGNSGGPLVDLSGNLVGINTAIATNNGSNSGISFSIPANLVKRVAKELLEKGTVSRGYLGLQLAPTLEPMKALSLGLNSVRGAMVEGVHPEGPAALGGLMQGDVILKLDATDIRDENHLINMISTLPVNQRIRMVVWRGKNTKSVDVVIGDWTTSVPKK
ncbi:MAG: S1C family serine protease [Fimbriiglobus sp.]